MWRQYRFFDQQNYVKKVRGNNVDFSTINITSKIVLENNEGQNYVETKVRGNNVDIVRISKHR